MSSGERQELEAKNSGKGAVPAPGTEVILLTRKIIERSFESPSSSDRIKKIAD